MKRMGISRKWAIFMSIVACLAIMYVCTVTGVASISFQDANRILFHEILHLDISMEGISGGSITIIRNVRLQGNVGISGGRFSGGVWSWISRNI